MDKYVKNAVNSSVFGLYWYFYQTDYKLVSYFGIDFYNLECFRGKECCRQFAAHFVQI
ncbi:MAG: hypothetical protein ACI8YQ_002118 [Polaribacter sp.]|jgi:hypothetical protein